MNKRLCLALTALMLVLCVLPAGAESTDGAFVLWGYDGENTYRDWQSNLFFKRMEEKTGIRFELRQFQDRKSWTEAKAQLKADSADLPDVLFKADLSDIEAQRLFDEGVLIDLCPLLEEHCPHLYAILRERPDVLSQITLPGGQIIALPYISESPTQNYPWINAKWLSALKLEMPADIDPLTETLRAFRTRDPNGNGRQDEIPLSFLGVFDLKFLQHGFGLIANDYNIFAEDGRVCFAPAADAWRRWLTWCRDAYREGLLDRNGFFTSDAVRQVSGSSSTQVYGMLFNPSLTNLFPGEWVTDYRALTPLAHEGRQRYRSLFGNVYTGTFAITAACREPEKLLEWADCLYTEEGALLASLGQENVDYVVDGDGTWRISEQVRSNSSFAAEALISSGDPIPGVSTDSFQARYAESSIAGIVTDMVDFNRYCVLPFPHYTLNEEEKAYITPLQNRLGAEIDLQASRWILGEEELDDAAYSAFLERLDQMGLPEFIAFWQRILDRTEGKLP